MEVFPQYKFEDFKTMTIDKFNLLLIKAIKEKARRNPSNG